MNLYNINVTIIVKTREIINSRGNGGMGHEKNLRKGTLEVFDRGNMRWI